MPRRSERCFTSVCTFCTAWHVEMSRTVVVLCVFSTIFSKLKRNLKLDDARTFPLVNVSTLLCGLAGGAAAWQPQASIDVSFSESPSDAMSLDIFFATFELRAPSTKPKFAAAESLAASIESDQP